MSILALPRYGGSAPQPDLPAWITSRWSARYWHRGVSFATAEGGSPFYYKALCGGGAGAHPHVFFGEVPPSLVEVDRQSNGIGIGRRRICLKCASLDASVQ